MTHRFLASPHVQVHRRRATPRVDRELHVRRGRGLVVVRAANVGAVPGVVARGDELVVLAVCEDLSKQDERRSDKYTLSVY